jgi:hypothetical protein
VSLWHMVTYRPGFIGSCAARVVVCWAAAHLWLYGFRFARQLIPRQPLADDLSHG